jgi:hypothetical protein
MTKNDGMTLDRKMGVKQHGSLLTYKDRNLCGKMPVGSAEMCKQSPERNWVGGSSRFHAPSAWKKRPGAHGLRILACALALLLNSLTDLHAQAATADAEAERISDLQRREILGGAEGAADLQSKRYIQIVLLPTGIVLLIAFLLRGGRHT